MSEPDRDSRGYRLAGTDFGMRFGSGLLIELEIRNPLEVATVASHYGEVMMQRGCRDQDVHLADRRALLLKVTANDRELPHDLQVEGDELDAFYEFIENLQRIGGVGGVVRTLIQLGVGDVADRQAFRGQFEQRLLCLTFSVKGINDLVRVDQVAGHSLTGGRVEIAERRR